MEKKYDKIRSDYRQTPFGKKDVDKDPFKQFADWMDRAITSGIKEPTAMALSTVNKNLQPSSRMVLLKEIKNDGFIFYTNYESKKGHEISENHYGSLLFYWPELEKHSILLRSSLLNSAVVISIYLGTSFLPDWTSTS